LLSDQHHFRQVAIDKAVRKGAAGGGVLLDAIPACLHDGEHQDIQICWYGYMASLEKPVYNAQGAYDKGLL
jgi:hypothetical protein